ARYSPLRSLGNMNDKVSNVDPGSDRFQLRLGREPSRQRRLPRFLCELAGKKTPIRGHPGSQGNIPVATSPTPAIARKIKPTCDHFPASIFFRRPKQNINISKPVTTKLAFMTREFGPVPSSLPFCVNWS